MTHYMIQAKTADSHWGAEGGGDVFDSVKWALAAVRWLERHEPQNDDGEQIEYRVVDDVGAPVV